MGRNLRVLERHGLFTLDPSDDDRARASAVRITPLGGERLAAARPHWESAQARMRDRLGSRSKTLLVLLADTGSGGTAQ